MKLKFSWRNIEVESKMAQEFMSELKHLCELYQIGFELQAGDFAASLNVVPFKNGDFGMFFGDLESYNGGVPWLDDAKKEWLEKAAVVDAEITEKRKADYEAGQRLMYERLKQKYEGK